MENYSPIDITIDYHLTKKKNKFIYLFYRRTRKRLLEKLKTLWYLTITLDLTNVKKLI